MKKNPFSAIMANFFSGLIIIIPVVTSLWLIDIILNLLSVPIQRLTGGELSRSMSVIISFSMIAFLGFITKYFVGRTVGHFLEGLMNRIPLFNIIYKSVKQIVNAFSLSNKSLLSAVLVEYPRKGVWALAFITKQDVSGFLAADGHDFGKGKVALFVPTTPNPTSGYFIYAPESDIIKLSLSIEDSIKILMSAGVISPNKQTHKVEEKDFKS